MKAQVLAMTNDMNREEWLEARKAGLGGSDIGAIAGLNQWRSPMTVYLEKTSSIENNVDNEFIYWGNVLEDVVAQEFSKRSGMKVRRRNAMLYHPEKHWALANVDRLIVTQDDKGPGILECKTAGFFKKEEWNGEEVPASYLTQLQWYFYVTGYQWGYFAVLIGGNQFVMKRVDRDEELIEQLVELGEDFWMNNVQKKVPPPLDGSAASSDILSYLYPSSNGQEMTLEPSAETLIENLIEAKQAEKEAKETVKLYENQLKDMLGEYEKGRLGDRLVQWKSYVTNRFDAKALAAEHPDIYQRYLNQTESRRFSVK
ncbi:YqaJ viral recombinase family protein [Pseudobacillus badius]|uniref:YqaJ viral recombinase family nuclease n=1 Tax=Bacillus badius TaxID=1455 RepID=UPI0024A34019|nr:YqaJ viral recombinase family protein [Bacillus badius]GLY10362.1 hypothetical protein Bbad01_15780 [Bacillus badius]